jgi:formate hydrogenlyase subunit 6/NADH:ubiquinone oxidoreductase subunit I
MPTTEMDRLIQILAARGYEVLAPTLRDGAIVYDVVQGAADLPAGVTDVHEPGRYRTRPRTDRRYFGFNVGPHSWKRYLHPPLLSLWRARRTASSMVVEPTAPPPTSYAFIGVRACELAAIRIQDKVFSSNSTADPSYVERRQRAFIVSVDCAQAGGTCFCVSTNTGPANDQGYDLNLIELCDEAGHEFVVHVGSEAGAAVVAQLSTAPATARHEARAAAQIEGVRSSMGRQLPPPQETRELLSSHRESDRWADVAQRCLACSNCTMVCPTCFCTAVEDVTELDGETAERRRRWDSCFSEQFSYIHGGSLRPSIGARYRQWISHKLSTWQDQFGSSGCVGCGRCITWCPVGIDITTEVRAFNDTPTS